MSARPGAEDQKPPVNNTGSVQRPMAFSGPVTTRTPIAHQLALR